MCHGKPSTSGQGVYDGVQTSMSEAWSAYQVAGQHEGDAAHICVVQEGIEEVRGQQQRHQGLQQCPLTA